MLVRVGRRGTDQTLDWPPFATVAELAYRVKRFHLGEGQLVGDAGVLVDVAAYVDTAGRNRLVYQLRSGGELVGEYKSVDELGRKVDLGALVDDIDDIDEPDIDPGTDESETENG